MFAVAITFGFIIVSGQLGELHRVRSARVVVRAALEAVVREGKTVTRDLGGTANTAQFTDCIIGKLKPNRGDR